MLVTRPGEAEALHTHFVARTDAGAEVRLVDPRTFGFVAVFTPDELASQLHLGRDALSDLPRTPQLAAALDGRTAPIKSLLLDQRIIAGLGNIYADEVLHRARVRPTRPWRNLEPASRWHSFAGRSSQCSKPASRPGEPPRTTWRILLPDGQAGDYLDRLRVYGREGLPCRRAAQPIERVVVGGRSSFFCPHARCEGTAGMKSVS